MNERKRNHNGENPRSRRRDGRPDRARSSRRSHQRSRGRRGRARRGEARYVLLDALRDGPKHGYEIIKALEERSSGEYIPSPGTVYPTLQYLEDLGLVRAQEEADRRVYHLTEAGRAELDAQAQRIDAFWARFAGPAVSAATQAEIGFLQDELDQLARTVWGGLRNAQVEDDHEMIHRVLQAVQSCRNEIRDIIAGPSAAQEEEA